MKIFNIILMFGFTILNYSITTISEIILNNEKRNLRGISAGKEVANTVDELIVDSYLGDWYQIYGAPTNILFQGYGTCITANYDLMNDGNISVINSQLNKNEDLEQIYGYAYYKDINEPGKLTVHLDGVPTDSPYWVILLGEIVNGLYEYAVITTPSGISLWVLVRNIDDYFEKYDNIVKDFLDYYNFNYVIIYQNNDCLYYWL